MYLSDKNLALDNRHLAVNISSPKVRELHDDFLWRERALDDKINRELIVLNYDFFLQDFLPKLLRTNHGLKIIKSGERANGQIKRRKVGNTHKSKLNYVFDTHRNFMEMFFSKFSDFNCSLFFQDRKTRISSTLLLR